MVDGENPTGALDFDRLIGELSRLQVRYPKLIHHLSRHQQSIYIWYFIEDLAIECARVLREAGVQAEHHSSEARAVQLPASIPMPEGNRGTLLRTLERYLERCASGAI